MSYRLYTFFIWAGNLATGLLIYKVIKTFDYDLCQLLWLLPLIIIIEFGCFASRDRKYEYKK
jgi:hypothetical protein